LVYVLIIFYFLRKGLWGVMGELKVSLLDLLIALSDVMDMISPVLNGHHRRVAYISYVIGEEMGLSSKSLTNLFIASLLHDCGGISLKERLDALQFDIINPYIHSELGYRLLVEYEPLEIPAQIVRYHHAYWNETGGDVMEEDQDIPLESYIINLSDRVDVLVNKKSEIIGQSMYIKNKIISESGKKFMPDVVDAFISVSKPISFWLDIINVEKSCELYESKIEDTILDENSIFSATELIRDIIDFRSRFTATHSSGVSAVAAQLGKHAVLEEKEQKKLRIAGFLHDLGKLAVPAEILEKPGKLNAGEYNIIKSHTYYTYKTLQKIKGFEEISEIAAFHHEKLDGSGYPFGITSDGLSYNSRIMAVADVFTALTEDRPYRKGMDRDTCLSIMQRMVDDMVIDGDILKILTDNYESINNARIEAQSRSQRQYVKHFKSAERSNSHATRGTIVEKAH